MLEVKSRIEIAEKTISNWKIDLKILLESKGKGQSENKQRKDARHRRQRMKV